MSKKSVRLINQFSPEHYTLRLELDKDQLRFNGAVTIRGQKTGRPSKRITFHQKGLKITEASITHHSKNEIIALPVTRILHHKVYDEVRLHSEHLLRPGKYEVSLSFTGTITKEMVGIYASRFKDGKHEETILATQFESHHAREAFPCIDEPEAKATFSLTLQTNQSDVVLSNTPVLSQKDHDQWRITTFETTPRMSTYLLAFVTGKLHSVSAKTKAGTTVTSWSSIAREQRELTYANNEAVRLLEFYEDYFGIPYPLPKCDQVALPDFDAGAMENWGLITYREIALLTDPENRSVSNEQYVSLVVAHELSHQWFGNLVTMKWWDDLWLNESFASFMEHLALDALHPDWRQWELYTSSDVLSTTNRDIYKDIQPVGVTVTDPDLIETLFDPGIVYAKGGRLLKMLRDYIGDEAFRTGLKAYFKKHAFQNTTREDLWQALSAASGKDISGIMTPWIVQSGMPLVRVEQDGRDLRLSQERYVLDSNKDTTIWPIPLLASRQLPTDILTKQNHTFRLDSAEPVILNHLASGHYFVQYANANHRQFLAEQLKKKQLPTEARINILNDSYMLARKGDSSLTDALELILPLRHEDRDSVWTLISRIIGAAYNLTEGDLKDEANLKKLKVTLANAQYQALGWRNTSDDDTNTRQLRHTMIAFMLGGEDEATISKALAYARECKDPIKIDAEIRNSILSAIVRHGDAKERERLIVSYPESSPDLQQDITAALTSTKDADYAEMVIKRALGKDGFVRAQDIMRWLALYLRNRYTRAVAWDFLVKEWAWIEQTLGGSKSFDFLPVYAAGAINSESWQQKYHELFEPKLENKLLERNIKVGFADINARLAWRQRDEALIKKFLQEKIETL